MMYLFLVLPPPVSSPALCFFHLLGWQWFATGTVKMVVNVSLQTPASVNLAGTDLPAAQVTPLQLPCSWESIHGTSHCLKFRTAWLGWQQ